MNFSVVFGIFLLAIGAFSSGSFAVPFGKIKQWNWETYWLIFSFGGYIIFPWIACSIFAPGMFRVFQQTETGTLLTVFLLGAVYGIGNLSFGLALRYLGLSLGYALSLGLMLAIGTLIPPLLDGRLQLMVQSSGGTLLIAGVVVAMVGIIFSAWAGILKDKSLSAEKKKETIGEFNFTKGILSALLVGFAGSAMALGFEKGMLIANVAEEAGVNPLFAMMPVYVIFLVGTFITTLIWCIFLGVKNKSLPNYVQSKNKRILYANYAFALLAGLLWFSQYIFYSMGKSKMGPFTFTSWGILMALTIAFATVWGLIRKEWKGASAKVYVLMALSLLILIAASFIIGISGSE
ncbi:MAG: L-rhamnose/proton symporter RhaT [Draconibacterium sp.]